jgi:hypothetical protein
MAGLLAPASAGAAGWTRAATLSPVNRSFDLGRPAVAVSGDGEAVVASAGNGIEAGRRVRVALGRGGRFGRSRTVGRGRDVVAAMGPNGTAAVAWTSARDALNVVVRPPRGRFGAAQRLAGYGAEPRVAVGPDGAVAVTWLDRRRDFTQAKAAFAAPGGSFGAPVALDASSYVYPVEAAYDAGGDLALAWSAQSQPGAGPSWAVKVIHRSREGALGAVEEPGSGYAYDVRLARSGGGATAVSWIGNSGPESGTLGPTQTALAPAGGAFDGPVSPAPGDSRTLQARVTFLVGDRLLTSWQGRRGPLKAAVRSGGAFAPATVLTKRLADFPELLAVGDGGALVVWSDPRLRFARLLPGGGWTRLGRPRGTISGLRATAAAGQRVLVAWIDRRGRVRAAMRSL